MAKFKITDFLADEPPGEGPPRRGGPPPAPRRPSPFLAPFVALILICVLAYPIYFWTLRRVVVPRDHVLVLLKKDGTRSLPDGQIIIPRPPAKPDDAAKLAEWEKAHAEWEETYRDCNGILEQVYTEGTYFDFSPFDYEREIIDISRTARVPPNKVGIVIRKFGTKLAGGDFGPDSLLQPGQVLADREDQMGPLPITLPPGQHTQYANPYAYEIIQVDPVQVNPGHRGVVTLMAGRRPESPNTYLVQDGERGVQQRPEAEDFLYVNPYEKRINPISVRSERFEMRGDDAISFPSYDTFDIRLEGVVEWRVKEKDLPRLYVEYGEGAELIPLLRDRVILPYARSYSRLVGSRYNARDFISGESKLEFQREFEKAMREECDKRGIEVLQALVRDIVPPRQIKEPINEREIAKQHIETIRQQIAVAKSQAALATQEEMAQQNKAIGEMNREVVVLEQEAQQHYGVAVTRASQELEVAKLNLEAAVAQAKAMTTTGEAEAFKVLAQKQAEAEPLRQQIAAFGDGSAYAQYFFYQKVAPAVKSILTDTEGTFGELFRQLVAPQPPAAGTAPAKLTEVQQ